MKNKGKVISLAVCIGILNAQMSAPYYTTIANAEEFSIKRQVKENKSRNSYVRDSTKNLNSELRKVSENIESVNESNSDDSESGSVNESNSDDSESGSVNESNSDDGESVIEDGSNSDDGESVTEDGSDSDDGESVTEDGSNSDDSLSESEDELNSEEDKSNIMSGEKEDLGQVESPMDTVNKIILEFSLEGINYNGKLPEKISLEKLESTLNKAEESLLEESNFREDVFFTVFKGWYLDEEYKEKLDIQKLDKDIERLHLFPKLEEIKEIEVKFHNESKVDINLPDDISFKKSDDFKIDIMDDNILGFSLKDSEELWDFEKDKIEDNLDKIEDNLDKIEDKNILNLYAKLNSNIEIKEELTDGGDYKLKGRLEEGELMELIIDPEKGYIVDKVNVLDSENKLIAEGENIETLNFEVPADEFTIKIDFQERPSEIDEIKLEIYSNGGSFVLDGSKEEVYETELDYYSKAEILKELENNIYRDIEIKDKFNVYTFNGWYLDEYGEKAFNIDSKLIEDTKIYAGWKVNETDEVNIKFNSNLKNDEGIELPENQVLKMDNLSLIEEPEKFSFVDKDYDKYDLKAWFLKANKEDEDKNIFWDFEEDKIEDKLDYLVARDGKVYLDLYADWDVIDLFETGTESEPFEIRSAQALVALSKKVSKGKNYKDCYFSIVENIDLSEVEQFKAIGDEENYFSGNIKAEKVRHREDSKEEDNKEEDNKEEDNKEEDNKEEDNKEEDNKEEDNKEEDNKEEDNKEEDNKEEDNEEEDNKEEDNEEEDNKINSKDDYYKIIGLNINNKEDYQGLFGHINGANLENIIVEGKVKAKDNVGGLVGFLGENSRIKNSISRVDVSGNTSVGGLVGYADDKSRLNDLRNEGKVFGEENVGGIIGEIGNHVSLSNFVNIGDIEGNEKVAGLIGEAGNSNNLYNLTNDGGSVLGSKYVSGIVGKVGSDAKLDYIRNTGNISATDDRVGGLVGHTDGDISISNSSNTGVIKGRKEVGGILGYSDSAIKIIEKSYNTGNIRSKGEEAWRSYNSYVGGVIGLIDSSNGGKSRIVGVYNTGDITGKDFTAGILGSKDNNTISGITIQRSFNQGNISGENYVGGITGFLPKASQITDSYNTGRVRGDENIAGIAGAAYYIKNSNVEVNSTYIRDSYNYGNISGENKLGAILSDGYTEKNSNNFYLATSIDNPADSVESLTAKSREAFKHGEVAYFLDTESDGLRKGLWSQGNAYPIFVGKDRRAVYKVSLDIKGSEKGSVRLEKSYVNGRDEVNFTIEPSFRHIVKYVEVEDRKNNIYDVEAFGNSYKFKMQEEDVKILVEFMEEPTVGEYNVDFKLDDKIYDSKKVKAGKMVEKPVDPEKENYKFIGWYLDGERYNFTRAVLKDLVLEARFQSADEVIINFDTNIPELEDGTKEIEAVKIKKGSKLSKPVDPVRESNNRLKIYEFKGWFTEKTDGEEWDFTKVVEEDMTLYAQWEEKNDIPDGFEFKTAEELRILGDSVNSGNTHRGKRFYLANDIDLNDHPKMWESIGFHDHMNIEFADGALDRIGRNIKSGSLVLDATLDGRGHTITLQPEQSQSFIGAIGKNGVIKNINIYGKMAPNPDRQSFGGLVGYSYGLIDNVSVELEQEESGSPTYAGQSGGLVAVNFADIRNVDVKVEMVTFNVMPGNIGGIAGATQTGKIENIRVKSGSILNIITGSPSGLAYSGGAFGLGFGNSRKSDYFRNIVVEKGVTVKSDAPGLGGIMGNGKGHLIDCYNGADVYNSANGGTGGIVGFDYDGGDTTIERCINVGNITGVSHGTSWLGGVGGIAGGYTGWGMGQVGEIRDSYSLGTVTSLDDGEVHGIAADAYLIKNSYFYGDIDAGEKTGVSSNAAEIENSYYGSEDEEISDPNDNPNMNKNDVNLDLDYSGVKRASKEELGNGEVAYYLNNINGKQREKLLWGVNPETKLPDFGGIYYVRVSVDEIDSSKGEVSLIDKETGEKINLESERYAFIKKDHPYEVKIKVKSQEKDENGKDLGYGFDELKITIGEGDNLEIIDLIDKYEKREELIIDKDGTTEIEQSEELGEVAKEKPIIPQKPIVPDRPSSDRPSKDSDRGGSSGSKDSNKDGVGSGIGLGEGSGPGKGEGIGTGEGSGKGEGVGTGEGSGKGSNIEKIGESEDTATKDDLGYGGKASESDSLDTSSLVEDNSTKEELLASIKPLEDIVDMEPSQNIEEDEEDNDFESDPTEELEEDSDEMEELDEEDIDEDMEESKEESISFIEKLVDKVKANPFITALVAIGFIVINMLIAFFRFKNKKDD